MEQRFRCYPKCYLALADAATDEYVILMEDLRPLNYSMWPKMQTTPINHVARIMNELAKFHAISFALKDQQPAQYEKLKEVNDLWRSMIRSKGISDMWDMTFETISEALKEHSPQYAKIAMELSTNRHQILADYFADGACDPFGVIGHGDLWIPNLLFRYDQKVGIF